MKQKLAHPRDLFTGKVTIVSDEAIDAHKIYFPEKLALANKMLKGVKIPGRENDKPHS